MSCFQDALSNILPVDWLDPYGRTPFAKDAELSVDITIVETDDGIKATSVKNPPKAGSSRLIDAIKNALGVDMIDSEALCSSLQADDQGKQDSMINNDKKEKSDIIEPSSPGGSGHRDRNLGSQGSRPDESRQQRYVEGNMKDDEDAKEKAPK